MTRIKFGKLKERKEKITERLRQIEIRKDKRKNIPIVEVIEGGEPVIINKEIQKEWQVICKEDSEQHGVDNTREGVTRRLDKLFGFNSN